MPTCTKASLAGACYRGPRVDEHGQQTRIAYIKVLQLQAIGGFDYRTAPATLLSDANGLTCGFKPEDFNAAAVEVQANNATAAGATVPGATMADAIKCFITMTDYQLKQVNLWLDCQLGKASNYPK